MAAFITVKILETSNKTDSTLNEISNKFKFGIEEKIGIKKSSLLGAEVTDITQISMEWQVAGHVCRRNVTFNQGHETKMVSWLLVKVRGYI